MYHWSKLEQTHPRLGSGAAAKTSVHPLTPTSPTSLRGTPLESWQASLLFGAKYEYRSGRGLFHQFRALK